MRAMADAVVARCIEHIATLPAQPSCGDVDMARVGALCRAHERGRAGEGTALEPLLDRLFTEWIPRSFTAAGPGYLAFIPGGGLFPAALADFIADTVNRFTGVWQAAPALVQLEPTRSTGCATGWSFRPRGAGCSRRAAPWRRSTPSSAAANAPRTGHSSRRAVYVRSGAPFGAQVRETGRDHARLRARDRLRRSLSPSDGRLQTAVAADRRAGLTPFAVVSSAGTTNTGAIDPLDAIADFCATEQMWHHIDGAYGAFFYLCDELRPALRGLPRADSLTLDPHKGMFLPYGTGALLVRDGAALRAAHEATAAYLPAMPHPEEFYDPSQHGPELSRGFPGLRVWLSVKLFGTAAFRAALAEKRALTLDAARRVAALPGIVMDAEPELTLFAFHLTRPGASRADEDAMTRALMEGPPRAGARWSPGRPRTGGIWVACACSISARIRNASTQWWTISPR